MVGVLAMVLVAATMAAAGPESPRSAAPRPDVLNISYDDGRVTAEIRYVPLDEVIALLAARAGVQFHGELRDRREISARFHRTRFRDAVDRLLGDQNFTIAYDASGRPARVELWGMPAPRSVPTRGLPSGGLSRAFFKHPPVTLPPLLARAFGTPTATLPWLLRRGLRDADPGVRAAAVAHFTRVLNGTPGLASAMQGADDQTLRRLIRSWAGNGEGTVLESLTSGATDPMLRSKARRILEQLKPTQGRPRPFVA